MTTNELTTHLSIIADKCTEWQEETRKYLDPAKVQSMPWRVTHALAQLQLAAIAVQFEAKEAVVIIQQERSQA